ncbi:MAG TPA: hypothetical protein DCY79_09060 [Planctomycetaceae bacterium]|nr:hypothetical protein [Blastopirellula sp.]HAY79939.1 hypothetical protein [Planctomycetaceae bacterium]
MSCRTFTVQNPVYETTESNEAWWLPQLPFCNLCDFLRIRSQQTFRFAWLKRESHVESKSTRSCPFCAYLVRFQDVSCATLSGASACYDRNSPVDVLFFLKD